MVYLAMGYKSGFGPVVKVMKYDTDNYLTVANTAYDRFYFNSENDKISYMKEPIAVLGVNSTAYPPTNGDLGNLYLLDGNNSTVTKVINGYSYVGSHYHSVAYFIDRIFPGDFTPIFEARVKNENGRFRGASFFANNSYQAGIQHNGVIGKATGSNGNDLSSLNQLPSRFGYSGWVGKVAPSAGDPYSSSQFLSRNGSNGPQITNNVYSVFWDLPCDNTPVPIPSQTPVPGQEVLRLNKQGLIMARRGYTVDGSSGRQRIIDSTRNPPLCLMAGDTPSIPAGGSVFIPAPLGFPLSESMIVDMVTALNGRDFMMPMFDRELFNNNTPFQITYLIAASGITFYNESPTGSAIVRYVVFGSDFSPPSTGGNEVMRRVPGGIQIKKPGSSDTSPNVNDILLDTRFPTLQLIQEGYIPIDDFNENPFNVMYGKRAKTINFSAGNMFVFPKVIGHFPHAYRQSYGCLIKQKDGSGNWGISNQSVVTVVQNNKLIIHTSKGQPTNWNNGWKFDQPDPLGVRYYLLAVTPRA